MAMNGLRLLYPKHAGFEMIEKPADNWDRTSDDRKIEQDLRSQNFFAESLGGVALEIAGPRKIDDPSYEGDNNTAYLSATRATTSSESTYRMRKANASITVTRFDNAACRGATMAKGTTIANISTPMAMSDWIVQNRRCVIRSY